MSTLEKKIFYLGKTFFGHSHHYILTDYVGDDIRVPHKKPRKSKKNPVTSLSKEQKAENQALSKIRIFVENAICGLKRYNILVHRFRNHKKSFDDDVIGIAAGLWNFNLSY